MQVQLPRGYVRNAAAAITGLALSGLALADGTDPGIAAINDLSAKATAYQTAAFAVVVLVTVGFWGMSMFKKSTGKAK